MHESEAVLFEAHVAGLDCHAAILVRYFDRDWFTILPVSDDPLATCLRVDFHWIDQFLAIINEPLNVIVASRLPSQDCVQIKPQTVILLRIAKDALSEVLLVDLVQ